MGEDERRVLLERAVKKLEEKIKQAEQEYAALLLQIIDRKKDLQNIDKTVVAAEVRASDRIAEIAKTTDKETAALSTKNDRLKGELSVMEGDHARKMAQCAHEIEAMDAHVVAARKRYNEAISDCGSVERTLAQTKRDVLKLRTELNKISL